MQNNLRDVEARLNLLTHMLRVLNGDIRDYGRKALLQK